MNPTSETVPIMLLPPETTISVLRMLDLRSLLRCQKVCRHWYKIVRDTMQLQYDMELELHGLEDTVSSDASIKDRLDAVRNTQAVWRKSAFGRQIPVFHRDRAKYVHMSIDQGAILLGEYFQAEIRITRVYFEAPYVRDFICSLPLDPNRRLKALTLDPSQGVIAILTVSRPNIELSTQVCLQIRSLATGQAHPLAGSDAFNFSYAGDSTANLMVFPPEDLQFSGSHMRASFLEPALSSGPRLLSIFWNWKTGIQYMHIKHSHSARVTLIDEEYAILGKPNMLTEQGHCGALLVFCPARQTSDTCTTEDVVFECAFLLPISPSTDENAERFDIDLRTSSTGSRTMAAFRACDDADRLIIVGITDPHRAVPGTCFRLLISYSRVVAMVHEKAKRSMVPWSEWKGCVVWIGPEPESIVEYFTPPQITAGMRAVMPPHAHSSPGRDRAPWSLRAMDFNSWRVARALNEGLYPGEYVEHSSSVSAIEGWFEDDIVIEYPYLVKTAEIPRPAPAHVQLLHTTITMIAEDGVFISETDATSSATTLSKIPFIREESTGAIPA